MVAVMFDNCYFPKARSDEHRLYLILWSYLLSHRKRKEAEEKLHEQLLIERWLVE